MQGKSKKAPPYERVLAHFLKQKKVRSAIVPDNFPLGYARALAAEKIRLQVADGLFWPEREAGMGSELATDAQGYQDYRSGNETRCLEVLGGRRAGNWNGRARS